MEEVSRIFNSDINTSLASGTIVFVFSLAIVPKLKPKFILTINEKNKLVIDYFKLVIFSVLLGASMSICVFLWMYQGRVVEKIKDEDSNFRTRKVGQHQPGRNQARDHTHKAGEDTHQAREDTHQAGDHTHQAGDEQAQGAKMSFPRFGISF